MAPSLPRDWHEVERPQHITEKYRATNPTLFVREDVDAGVHVRPVSTSSPHDPERYLVGAIRGGRTEFEYELEVGAFDAREAALERAVEFANRFDEVYESVGEVEAALEGAVNRVS